MDLRGRRPSVARYPGRSADDIEDVSGVGVDDGRGFGDRPDAGQHERSGTFYVSIAVVTTEPCRISHMRERDVPPILRFSGNFLGLITQ